MNTKMKKTITMFLTLVICATMLTGCGSSKYVGEWHAVKCSNNGVEVDIEQLEQLTGQSLNMTLQKDGSVKLNSSDTEAGSKWEESGDGIIIYDGDDKSNAVTYTYKDNQLVCNVAGMELFMEKQ